MTPLAPPSVISRAHRTFKQRRAAATYQKLLDAAAAVFARRGFEGAQTPEIAAAAGVSTGAFYRYFTDKRQAFIEVIAEYLRRSYDDVMKRLRASAFRDGGHVREALDVVIGVLFDIFARDRDLDRVFMSMSLRDPEVERLRAEYDALGREALARLIAEVIPRSNVPSPRAAALVIGIAAQEVAADRAGLRPSAGPAVPDADVRLALREMIYRFLYCADEAPKVASARAASAKKGRSVTRKPASSRRTG